MEDKTILKNIDIFIKNNKLMKYCNYGDYNLSSYSDKKKIFDGRNLYDNINDESLITKTNDIFGTSLCIYDVERFIKTVIKE